MAQAAQTAHSTALLLLQAAACTFWCCQTAGCCCADRPLPLCRLLQLAARQKRSTDGLLDGFGTTFLRGCSDAVEGAVCVHGLRSGVQRVRTLRLKLDVARRVPWAGGRCG
eukprot:364550-Chlamydomonas_euryale.AAC.4